VPAFVVARVRDVIKGSSDIHKVNAGDTGVLEAVEIMNKKNRLYGHDDKATRHDPKMAMPELQLRALTTPSRLRNHSNRTTFRAE
jgi:hypothetical protein